MSTKAAWDTEGVPERSKIMWFICNLAKTGKTDEQMLVLVPPYILQNKFKPLEAWDLENMCRWAIRKFGKK